MLWRNRLVMVRIRVNFCAPDEAIQKALSSEEASSHTAEKTLPARRKMNECPLMTGDSEIVKIKKYLLQIIIINTQIIK